MKLTAATILPDVLSATHKPLPPMLRCIFLSALLLGLGAAVSPVFSPTASAQSRRVVVNDEPIAAATLGVLDSRYGVRIQDGAYWYDAASGAWGFEGGPTVSFVAAGVRIGGSLRANASRGRTAVYINRRRLPVQDLAALQRLTGPIQPGRYWLDGAGNAGFEGGPALVNLAQLARRAGGNGAFHRSGVTDTGSNSSGGSGYIMGRDWSVSW